MEKLKDQSNDETMGIAEFKDLIEIVRALRAPEGCPWDREQTMESLRYHILEEAHELIESIEEQDAKGVREECGDVLLHVVFLASLAQEQGLFDMRDIIQTLSDKLVRRHPHVFSDTSVSGSDEVSKNWERIKAEERKEKERDSSAMAGVPKGLPGLLRAHRIQDKAAKKGFDWPEGEISAVKAKVLEELEEIREALLLGDIEATGEELGDSLFAMVNLTRHLGLNAESLIQQACNKFSARFRHVEDLVMDSSRNWEDFSLEELEEYWCRAKKMASGTADNEKEGLL